MPTVSVVIPLYNCATYIGEALASVVGQTRPPDEIIVVDDGSHDDGPRLAEAFPGVRLVRKPHTGQFDSLNQGVALATGDYLAFLDSDDLWTPSKLARQLESFARPSPPDLVFGHAQQFVSPELPEAVRRSMRCPPEPMAGYVSGTLLLPRTVFERVGPMRAEWAIGPFVEWYARARDLGLRVELLPEVLMHRRLHQNNVSRRLMSSRVEFAHIVKAILDRRRGRA
jgi:glycosyltransferase involved in cell wall biosynthesis